MAPEAAKRRKSGRRLGRRLGRALSRVLEGALQQPLIVLLGAALLFATTGTGVLGARHDSTPDSLSERGRALSRSKTAWPQVVGQNVLKRPAAADLAQSKYAIKTT